MRIKLKASIFLGLLVFFLHAFAFLIVILLPLLLLLKLFLLLLISISLPRSLLYSCRKTRNSLIELGKQAKDAWWAVTYQGELYRLKILPDTIVTGKLICLHVKNQYDKRLSSLIFSWELDKASFRELAVALRIQ